MSDSRRGGSGRESTNSGSGGRVGLSRQQGFEKVLAAPRHKLGANHMMTVMTAVMMVMMMFAVSGGHGR